MYENLPPFEHSSEPRDPGEWIDRRQQKLQDQLEYLPFEIAEMKDDGRWVDAVKAERSLAVTRARVENLIYLREVLADDYSAAGIKKVLEIYEEQAASQIESGQSAEILSKYSTLVEQVGVDGISARQSAVAKDTVGLLAFFTSYLEGYTMGETPSE